MKKRWISWALALLLVGAVLIPNAVTVNAASERWEVVNTGNVTGEDIVAKAREFIGVPYTSSSDYKTRTGFGNPVRFDCSGFVYRVLREVDLGSPRQNYTMGSYDPNGFPLEGRNSAGYYYITAHTQEQRYYGTRLEEAVKAYKENRDYSGFKPGDLISFSYNGGQRVSHVGIYVGDGKVIHATTSRGIIETPLTQGGWPNGKLGDSLFDATRLVSEVPEVAGDITGDGEVNNDDVLYLMWHNMFPEQYPIKRNADFTGDGEVNNNDVLRLMWHNMFPEQYPI